MEKLYVFDHPLIQHKTAILRKKETSVKDFRELVKEISMLMCYEATRHLPLEDVDIETPMCAAKVKMLKGEAIALIPILRAGLGMADGMLNLIPNAKVGHIGLYRDHDTHNPVNYYCKLPSDIKHRHVFVLDPMLATGGSVSEAVRAIKAQGAEEISFMCIIAAPEGIKVMQRDHPDVDIFIAALDDGLDENAYIVPGLGDAGDRLYGTR